MAVAPTPRSLFQQALFEDDNESGYFTGLGRGDPFALRRLGGGAAPIYGRRWSPGSTFGMYGALPIYGTEDIVPINQVTTTGTDTGTDTGIVGDINNDGVVNSDDTAAYYDTTIVDDTIIGDTDGDGFVDVYDEDALLDLYNDENVADVITGIGGPEGQDVIIAASDPSDMLYESGQDLQAFNPDIDYGGAFVSDLTNQYVGTIGPDSFSDTTQAVAEAQGFPLDQFDDGVYSASDFPVGSSLGGTDYVSDYSTDVFSAGDTFANPQGSIVDIGYGIGEVDPALATAAGYTTAVADPEPTTIPEMIGDAVGNYIESGGMLGMIASELFGDEPYIGPTGFVNPHSNVGGIETTTSAAPSSDVGQIVSSELPDIAPDYDASSEVTPFTTQPSQVSDFVAGLENYQQYGDPLGQGTVITPDPTISTTTGMAGVDEAGNIVQYGLLDEEEDDGPSVLADDYTDALLNLSSNIASGDVTSQTEANAILNLIDPLLNNDYDGTMSDEEIESLLAPELPTTPTSSDPDLTSMNFGYTEDDDPTFVGGDYEVASSDPAISYADVLYGDDDDDEPMNLVPDDNETFVEEVISDPGSYTAPVVPETNTPELDLTTEDDGGTQPSAVDFGYDVGEVDPGFQPYIAPEPVVTTTDDDPGFTPVPDDNEAFIEDVITNVDDYIAPTPVITTPTNNDNDDDDYNFTPVPDDNDDFVNDVLINTDDYLAPIVDTGGGNDDDGGGGDDDGGTHCCTAAHNRGDMTMTEVKKLRAWHRKQDIVWQEGYDVWGKVIADHLVAKSKWSSDRVRDFYNHKIYGERTVGSTFADFVIYPMAYVIGAYKVASSKIKTFKEKANG